jgi:hypothetical protein
VFVLGAADAESAEIARVLRDAGETAVEAARADGGRVVGGEAYRADRRRTLAGVPPGLKLVRVECEFSDGADPPGTIVADHHRPGDPGFDRPPGEFLEASSLGQVLRLLGREPTSEQRLTAAADHCLAAAYGGRCPGIDPVELRRHRIRVRARSSGRTEDEVRTALGAAAAALLAAGWVEIGARFRDMRPAGHVALLPEAGTLLGEPYVAEVFERARRKVVASSPEPAAIAAFLRAAPGSLGLIELYGSPERGFAGGYVVRDAEARGTRES